MRTRHQLKTVDGVVKRTCQCQQDNAVKACIDCLISRLLFSSFCFASLCHGSQKISRITHLVLMNMAVIAHISVAGQHDVGQVWYIPCIVSPESGKEAKIPEWPRAERDSVLGGSSSWGSFLNVSVRHSCT